MRTALLALALLAGCAATDSGPSGTLDGPALDALLRGAVDARDVPGAVLLVGRGDEVLHLAAVGAHDRSGSPLAADAVFDLASLTKPVATATAVMVLADRGALDLDAPVSRYLPDFTGGDKERITPRDLLLHRSGLVADNPLADYEHGAEEAWGRICALELHSGPGSSFLYSDVGFVVLGRLVEAVDGRPLDLFCDQEVFGPLGMRDTGFRPAPDVVARCVPTEELDGAPLRGVVHDPRARALGGVAGHAGLFSTAGDLARWCRAVVGGGAPILSTEATRAMLTPDWLPDGTSGRALGLDVDSAYDSPRGRFPRGRSFGHTGFTGTSLWMHPASDTYVLLLASWLQLPDTGRTAHLRRSVSEAVADGLLTVPRRVPVRVGADVLAAEGCARLAGQRVALLTNRTGVTRDGRRTIDVLQEAPDVQLAWLLAPEHGLETLLDESVADGREPATGLPVWSLYGDRRRPAPEQLAGLDAVVFDVADAGVRFYTYATTLGYVMEEAGRHGVRVVVLDRPNPLGGEHVEGPLADPAQRSFVAYAPIPVVHGMTLGELARFYVAELGVGCELEVVPCEGWSRDMRFEATGVPWIDPSPNLRSPTQALLYPAIGLLEGTNLSVGRGTDAPFERFGAPWIDGPALADALGAAGLRGVAFAPIAFTPDSSTFAGERCQGVSLRLTDAGAFRPVATGCAIARTLDRLFGRAFDPSGMTRHLASDDAFAALWSAESIEALTRTWRCEVETFRERRRAALLYE